MATSFHLEVSFNDRTGQPVAAYMRVRDGQVSETREVKDGTVFADFDELGNLLGIELLAPCQIEVLDLLSQSEAEPVRRFLKGGAPRDLVCA